MRVPGFVHSPLLPENVQGTVDRRLYHITDWFPTLASAVGIALPEGGGGGPLDGHDIWQALLDPSRPSPRTEILHNLNQACGRGKMSGSSTSPSTALRLGDWKLLVPCFNVSTMRPDDRAVSLFNIAADPLETTDKAATQPVQVAQLLDRLTEFARSIDQIPPTLKPTLSNSTGSVTQPGSTSWNYQCPQCPASGASGQAHSGEKAWAPWCDGVACVPQTCSSLFFGDACSPQPDAPLKMDDDDDDDARHVAATALEPGPEPPAWEAWQRVHGAAYPTFAEERARERIYLAEVAAVRAHNGRAANGLETYTKAVNEWSDLTEAEFATRMGLFNNMSKAFLGGGVATWLPEEDGGPASLDWRAKGAVTGVKNQ